MTFDPNDDIDFNVMHAPPRFVTTVRTTAGTIVVVTDGQDFPGLVVQWPDALEEERAEDFWALGLLHLTDVELMKLPPETRVDAMAEILALDRHDPRRLASRVAGIIREATAVHPGIASTRFALGKADMETYRRLLIVRATAPYLGLDDVTIVNLHGGLIPA